MQAVCGQRPLRVAIFQYACRQENAAARLERLDAALADSEADLVICPELYLSGYDVGEAIAARAEPADGPSLRRLAEIARKNRVAVVCGWPEADGAALYNTAIALGKDGAALAKHRKLRLPNDFEKRHFREGSAITLFDLEGWRVGLCICFDAEFPEIHRLTARAGAALMAAPTALTRRWPFVSRSVMPVRAFENGYYLAYANYAGREGDSDYLGESRITGPDGLDRAVAGEGEALIRATLEHEAIEAARALLPYLPLSAELATR